MLILSLQAVSEMQDITEYPAFALFTAGRVVAYNRTSKTDADLMAFLGANVPALAGQRVEL